MNTEVNLIADSIVYAVQNQREKLTVILLKNGVVIPSGTSDAELILLVSEVFKKSKPFRKDFIDLLSKTEFVTSSFSGYSYADGFAQYSLSNISPITGKPLTADETKAKDSNSFWSSGNIIGLLNKAADTYSTISTNKANTALANAAQVRAEAGLENPYVGTSNVTPDKGSNTVLYVVLSVVAIGAIGGLVWYMSKAKK